MSIARPDAAPLPSDLALARLRQLHPRSIDLSLERIERLLAQLNHPERDFPPVFHIAGTNGKGSTLAFVRACLEQAGYRVHVYISPHLVRFNERIRLASELIGDDHLLAVLEECERVNDGAVITEFEVTTAAAFLAFRDVPADILLLETGLGGIYDATNVIERPALTAITTVSMDHPQFLGATVDEIAVSKAGILKPSVPGVIARQTPSVLDMMDARAGQLEAPLFVQDRDWRVRRDDDHLTYEDADGRISLPLPNLRGGHQTQNAGMAIACVRQLTDFKISDVQLRAGLQAAEWPARLQRLRHGPLFRVLPAEAEVWLDGGHNEAAGVVLAETVRRWIAADAAPRPLHLIFSMLSSKEPADFLKSFQGLDATIHCVPIPDYDACVPAADAAKIARGLGFEALVHDDAVGAARVIRTAAANPRILICGSLYYAGAILAEHG